MTGHGFGQEPPKPTEASGGSFTFPDLGEWLSKEWAGETVSNVSADRHGIIISFANGESYRIFSYLQESNPQPIFVRNTEWGRLP